MSNMAEIAASKLGSIVEAGRGAAARGIEALQREWNLRQDYVVKPSAIRPEVISPPKEIKTASGRDLAMPPYLVMRIADGGPAANLTTHAKGQLLERAGVPSRFADNLLSWGQGDLLVSNLERLLPVVSPEAVLVREVGGTVKAALSASYKRMDASPIFESFTEAALRFGLVPYRGEVSDTRAYLSFLKPEVKEIAPGEHVVFGVGDWR